MQQKFRDSYINAFLLLKHVGSYAPRGITGKLSQLGEHHKREIKKLETAITATLTQELFLRQW